MVRFRYILIFMLLVVACRQIEPLVEQELSDGPEFTAHIEEFDVPSKTSLANGNSVVWSSGDQIAIFQGASVADRYHVKEDNVGTKKGAFAIVAKAEGNSATTFQTNIALYPYEEGLECTTVIEDSEVTSYKITGVTIPSVQTYATGTFPDESFMMAAITDGLEDHTLNFKNLCGALMLQLKGTMKVKSVMVQGHDSERLSGEATVTLSSDRSSPIIEMSSGAAVTATLDCGEGVQLSESTTNEFIVTLPPTQFVKGFTVSIIGADGTVARIVTSKQNSVGRSYMHSMPELTVNANEGNLVCNTGAMLREDLNLLPSSYELASRPGEFFTYEYIPVEPSTTYKSFGGTRSWFLDINKKPISSVNIFKEPLEPFTFTTPENAAYISISYSTIGSIQPISDPYTVTIIKQPEQEDNVYYTEFERIAATHYAQWTKPVVTTAATYPKLNTAEDFIPLGYSTPGLIYSSTLRDGTDALWNVNPSTYYSAVQNPASVLYTEDNRGRVWNEAGYYGSVCSTTALKACGYKYPYNTYEVNALFTEKTDHSIENVEPGDILWTSGHVAGVVEVIESSDNVVLGVRIVEQSGYIRAFTIRSSDWETYFTDHWEKIYRGQIDENFSEAIDYPENSSIIFSRGNNTYVTDYSVMQFYIPSATKVYMTKDGRTDVYEKTSFPTAEVNGVTVYDLASLFTGVGNYWFHTDVNATDICIKVINQGTVTISGTTATVSGYENCKPVVYYVVDIYPVSEKSSYNFYKAPEGYTSSKRSRYFTDITSDTFEIIDIPESGRFKLDIMYDTGFGWARFLSEDIL